jgi:hypothetical protein
MGFLDKLKGAAQQVKAELEERGVDVDRVLGADRDAATSGPSVAQEPTEVRLRRAAAEQGRPDPYELATTEEVAAVLGLTLEAPTCGYADYEFGPSWRATGFRGDSPSIWLAMYQGEVAADTPEEASELIQEYAGMAEEPVVLAGIGDEAYQSDEEMVWFRVGRDVFYLYASRYGHDAPEPAAVVELARLLASRVPAA